MMYHNYIYISAVKLSASINFGTQIFMEVVSMMSPQTVVFAILLGTCTYFGFWKVQIGLNLSDITLKGNDIPQ